jgi:AcrR family transcriptional regulator
MVSKSRVTGAAARRASNREQMRTAILDAARSIVTDSGIDGLTIRAVATALDYSPGAIYEYFASKEDILTWLYFQGASGLGGRMEQAVADLPPGTSAVDGMMSLARAYRAHALANRELYGLVFGGMTCLPDPPKVEHPEMEAGGFGTLVRLAQRGVDEGSLVALPVSLIAHAAWSAVHGFVSLELQGHITGAFAPGMPTGSPELARQHRDEFFETVIRMMLVGFVTREYRTTMPDTLAAPARLTGTATELTD